jgi:transposase
LKEKTYAGIDVSKDCLDVAILPSEEKRQYPNDEEGIGRLISRLKELTVELVVLEPTGGFEAPVAAALSAEGIGVAIVNARQIKEYARATGRLAKTDKLDARVMAEFAAAIRPPVRPLRDEEAEEIKAMVSRRRQLLEMVTAEKNRRAVARKHIKPSIQAHIDWLKKELEDLDRDLRKRIEGSPLWRVKDNLLQSIPGVGKVLSATLSSTRHNPVIGEFYRRLVERGKAKKVALVACMRRLLTIMDAILRHGKAWQYA